MSSHDDDPPEVHASPAPSEPSERVCLQRPRSWQVYEVPGHCDLLGTMIDNLYEGVLAIDADHRVIYLNRALCQMHGLLPEATASWLGRADLYDETGERPLSADQLPSMRALRGELVRNWPFAIRPASGPLRRVVANAEALRDDDGRIVGAVVSVRDVTEQHLAEERLRRTAAQLAEAQRLSHVGSWEWDLPSATLSVSDEFYRIMGLVPQEQPIALKDFVARVHDEDRPMFRQKLHQIGGDPGHHELEFRLVRPSGQVRHVRVTGVSTTNDEAGRHVSRLGILQDITEQRLVELAKSEFLSVVSHELRTPLTSILGSLVMLSSGRVQPDSATGRSLIELALANTERMGRLVGDILDMERLATGRLTMRAVDTEARALLDYVAATLAPLAEKADVRLVVEGANPLLRADRDRLVQAITNLLDNAIAYSPPGGTIRLAVEHHGDEVWLSVQDQGPGIPADQQITIFQRFQQGELSSARRRQGLGLGLSIARDIVEEHGGRIWVESRPGEGATFRVALPRPA